MSVLRAPSWNEQPLTTVHLNHKKSEPPGPKGTGGSFYGCSLTRRSGVFANSTFCRFVSCKKGMNERGGGQCDDNGGYDRHMVLREEPASPPHENPFRWQFPENTFIPPHGYLLVWASGKSNVAAGGELHTNFGIAHSGEALILTARDPMTLIDQTMPVNVPRNVSYGRQHDGSEHWVFFDRNHISPGRSNNDGVPYDMPDWLNPNP